jgi:hypothetical protein
VAHALGRHGFPMQTYFCADAKYAILVSARGTPLAVGAYATLVGQAFRLSSRLKAGRAATLDDTRPCY